MSLLSACSLLLPCLGTPPGNVDADYYFGMLGAELGTSCTGNTAMQYAGEYGEIDLDPDGTFSLTSQRIVICPDSTRVLSNYTVTGTYGFPEPGTALLDFGGGNVEELYFNPEMTFAMRSATRGNLASVLFATRKLTGATNCLLDGEYAQVEYSLSRDANGGFSFESAVGDLTGVCTPNSLDVSWAMQWHEAGDCTVRPLDTGMQSVSILPNGSLVVSPDLGGAVMEGGEFAWWLSWEDTGPEGELGMGLMVRKGTAYMAEDYSGHYLESQLEGWVGLPPTNAGLAGVHGDVALDGPAGLLSVDEEAQEVSSALTITTSPHSGVEPISTTPVGLFVVGALPTDHVQGWLSESGEFAVFGVVEPCADAVFGLVARRRYDGPGEVFCMGGMCPCGNNDLTAGCRNSTGEGALLTATGAASVGADSLSLDVSQAIPNDFGIFVQNITAAGGAPFYDGLFCLAGDNHLIRHYNPPAIPATVTNAFGSGSNARPMTVGDFLGDTAPGVRVLYQYWYRNSTGPCGSGANFSNAVAVTWTP